MKRACQKLDTKCLRICAVMNLNYWECVNIHHGANERNVEVKSDDYELE